MDSSDLCTVLKEVARQYAFGNSEVLYLEARGRRAIESLLDSFWTAMVERKEENKIDSARTTARSRFIYSLVSANYIEAALEGKNENIEADHLRYRELRLLTDMLSGMTDQFTIDVNERIRTLQ